MRTTLKIDEDVLQASKELAQVEGITAGEMLSKLARLGLEARRNQSVASTVRNGVPVLPARGDIITFDKIERLLEEEGI